MLPQLLIATVGLVLHPLHTSGARSAVLRTVTPLASAEQLELHRDMPEQLSEYGCDSDLWNLIPVGSRKDLTRFLAVGKTDFIGARITALRDIAAYADKTQPGSSDSSSRL